MKNSLAFLILLSTGYALYGSDEEYETYNAASDMDSKIKVTSKGIAIDFDFDEDLKHITSGIGKKELIEDKKPLAKTTKAKTKKLPLVQFPQAYFSPGIKDVFIKFIHDEQEKLEGAWYRFTLYKAAQAIVEGIKTRNIAVTLAVNRDYTSDFCSPLKLIIDGGGKVFKKNKGRASAQQEEYEHLHHKFMIFHNNVSNKKLLWTGSFNATGQANVNNFENVIIIDDPVTIAKFQTEFANILTYCTPIEATDCIAEEKNVSKYSYDMNDIPLAQRKNTGTKKAYTKYPKKTFNKG